jgi:hypothetical protein
VLKEAQKLFDFLNVRGSDASQPQDTSRVTSNTESLTPSESNGDRRTAARTEPGDL